MSIQTPKIPFNIEPSNHQLSPTVCFFIKYMSEPNNDTIKLFVDPLTHISEWGMDGAAVEALRCRVDYGRCEDERVDSHHKHSDYAH